MYYKPIMIVNGDSSIVNKLETSVIDDARVVIYDRHMFIVQASSSHCLKTFFSSSLTVNQNKLEL